MYDIILLLHKRGIPFDVVTFIYSVKEKFTLSNGNLYSTNLYGVREDAKKLGLVIVNKDETVSLTQKGIDLIDELNTLTGYKDPEYEELAFKKNVEKYRDLFPKGKLPSGKPARQNIKALIKSFQWFFKEYDYTWEEIYKATRAYIREYEERDYLYMSTSQYFISKEDKSKVKSSLLADYCDMIKDGYESEDNFFQEKVV